MRISFILLVCFLSTSSLLAQVWTVQDAVESALATHPEAQRVIQVVEEARAQRRARLSLQSPSMFMEYEGIPNGSGIDNFEERRVGLSQDIEFPLRYLWIANQANVEIRKAGLQGENDLLDLEVQVRDNYLDAWSLSERKKILQFYVATLDSQAGTFRKMLEVGRASDLDYQRAVAEKLEAEQDLILLSRQVTASRHRLARSTGIEIIPDSLIAPLPQETVDHPDALVYLRNPAWKVKKAEVDYARIERKLAATSWMPSFELTGFKQRIPVENDPDFWGIEVGLSLPLWYWWGGAGEIQASTARFRQVQSQVAALEIDLGSEWSEQLAVHQAAASRHQAYLESLLPTSEEIARMAQRSFELGQASYLDVLEAQRTRLQRRFDYIDSVVSLVSSHIALDRLQGRSIINERKSSNGDNR